MPAKPTPFDDLGEAEADGWGAEFRRFLAAAMQTRTPWPFALLDAVRIDQAWQAIAFHGCALLIVDTQSSLDDWPEALKARLLEEARMQALWEASHKQSLVSVLDAMAAGGVDILVSKGTALAYSVFAIPAQRRRGDTDLLIQSADLDMARQVLSKFGCQRVQGGAMQEDWQMTQPSGFAHVFDLHWELSSAPALCGLYSPAEAFQRAVGLPRLSHSAKATDPVRTFLSDALNQAMHHAAGYIVDGEIKRGGHRLIWSYGTALQMRTFTQTQWDELAELAEERGIARLVCRALERACADFDADVPEDVLAALTRAGGKGVIDHFVLSADAWDRFRANWANAPDWRMKRDALGNALFTNEDFLRRKYPQMRGWPVPVLQARRILAAPISLLRKRS